MLGGTGDTVSIALASGQPVRVGATGNRYHHGRLVVRRAATNTLQVTLDSLTMQDYLYGISEVPVVVASRSAESAGDRGTHVRGDALGRATERDVRPLFDDTRSALHGIRKGIQLPGRTDGSRRSTRPNQQIVTYNGAPISAFYFSSSGGATENSEYVFVTTLPYARSVPDPFDNASGNSNFRWKRTYTGAELGAWLKASRSTDIGDVNKLDFLGPFGASGRIDRTQIRITGTKGTTQITGGQLMGTINANAPDSRQLLSSLVFIKPNGSFDAGGFAPGGVRVAGWTYYPYSGATAQVQITVDGNVVADVAANGARGDVAAVIPGAPSNAGFDVDRASAERDLERVRQRAPTGQLHAVPARLQDGHGADAAVRLIRRRRQHRQLAPRRGLGRRSADARATRDPRLRRRSDHRPRRQPPAR